MEFIIEKTDKYTFGNLCYRGDIIRDYFIIINGEYKFIQKWTDDTYGKEENIKNYLLEQFKE